MTQTGSNKIIIIIIIKQYWPSDNKNTVEIYLNNKNRNKFVFNDDNNL